MLQGIFQDNLYLVSFKFWSLYCSSEEQANRPLHPIKSISGCNSFILRISWRYSIPLLLQMGNPDFFDINWATFEAYSSGLCLSAKADSRFLIVDSFGCNTARKLCTLAWIINWQSSDCDVNPGLGQGEHTCQEPADVLAIGRDCWVELSVPF